MSVYVDSIQKYPLQKVSPAARRYGTLWCHLVSDSEDNEELHRFAQSIGLNRSTFQNHRFWSHYDLTPNLRARAVQNGAIEVDSLVQLAREVGKA